MLIETQQICWQPQADKTLDTRQLSSMKLRISARKRYGYCVRWCHLSRTISSSLGTVISGSIQSIARCLDNAESIRGRSRKLYLNYRTTDEIRKVAVALLEGREIDDLNGGSDDNRRYKSLSHGPVPEVITSSDAGSGMAQVIERVVTWMKAIGADETPPSVCVMARTKADRDEIARRLTTDGLATSIIDADSVDPVNSAVVRIATMHRAKGLEFDRVAVFAPGMLDDEVADVSRLVYVALTRAKAVALMVC
jgi:superfamily I DNA/RNA helicase